MLQISSLLLHNQDVPQAARVALASALQAPAERRVYDLAEAARILHREVGLDCDDALELVGLEGCDCGSSTDQD